MESNQPSKYRVLLYYKYVTIENPEQFVADHLAFCKKNGLLGRILVAKEGLNGTVSGTWEATQIYMDQLHTDPRFSDMSFKIDPADKHAFRKIFVRPRSEIVTLELGNEDLDPNEVTGIHLKPKEFLQAMQEPGVVILDARNDYESALGKFKGAIAPDVRNFRDLPEWVEKNMAEMKDKKILTYCTGGIRCEKFSGFLKRKGFKNVFQLEGGIVEYGKDPEVKGSKFDGECYVFDERIAVPVNHTGDGEIISKCKHSGKPTTHYRNCNNPECKPQYFCHLDHVTDLSGCCSPECEEKFKFYVETNPALIEKIKARPNA
jgi:UPF0176 protein